MRIYIKVGLILISYMSKTYLMKMEYFSMRTYNWMMEYLIVKICILPLCHQFDTSVSQYINTHKINHNNRFLHKN